MQEARSPQAGREHRRGGRSEIVSANACVSWNLDPCEDVVQLSLPSSFRNSTTPMNDRPDLTENYRGVFDGAMGFGDAPAVIVVDFIRAYTEPGSPLYAPAVVEAVKRTVPLLAAA